MHRGDADGVSLTEVHRAELGLADARCVGQYSLEHGLQIAGRGRYYLQYLRRRGLPLQRLGKVSPRLRQLTGARFELLFQLDQCGLVANVRSRLRSGRTKLAAACLALRPFERQGHLVGTAAGPPFRSAQPRIEPINPNTTAR